MTSIDLKQNFARILRSLEGNGMKPTSIAKSIGYTTTTQLNSTLAGESVLSTKAIMGLIENLNVNPYYLFLGKGDMFLTDESEIENFIATLLILPFGSLSSVVHYNKVSYIARLCPAQCNSF